MNGIRKLILFLIVTLILVSLSIVSERLYFSDFEYHFRTRAFNRILAEKEVIMESCLNDMKPVLAKDDHHGSISENNIFLKTEENNITILEYIDNKLIYWSDNEFDVRKIVLYFAVQSSGDSVEVGVNNNSFLG